MSNPLLIRAYWEMWRFFMVSHNGLFETKGFVKNIEICEYVKDKGGDIAVITESHHVY